MSTDTPINRRTVLKGAAWATPVIVLATAAPAAAATSNLDEGAWVAAVRTSNGFASATTAPGFRFGYQGGASPVTMTITISGVGAGQTKDTLFSFFGGTWVMSPATTDEHGTASLTSAITVGPVTFNGGPTAPGNTHGITLRGIKGTYTAAASADTVLSGHAAARITVP